jgi:hypothetical protein
MAKRTRNYAAEYARRKQIAQESGFPSVRKYRRTRERVKLPRKARFNITSIREANQTWSDDHSRLPTSRWDPAFNDIQALAYYKAFTDDDYRMANPTDWHDRWLHDYLLDNDLITEEEWEQNYALAANS